MLPNLKDSANEGNSAWVGKITDLRREEDSRDYPGEGWKHEKEGFSGWSE